MLVIEKRVTSLHLLAEPSDPTKGQSRQKKQATNLLFPSFHKQLHLVRTPRLLKHMADSTAEHTVNIVR